MIPPSTLANQPRYRKSQGSRLNTCTVVCTFLGKLLKPASTIRQPRELATRNFRNNRDRPGNPPGRTHFFRFPSPFAPFAPRRIRLSPCFRSLHVRIRTKTPSVARNNATTPQRPPQPRRRHCNRLIIIIIILLILNRLASFIIGSSTCYIDIDGTTTT